MSETERILVTGGAGFVGSHLVRRLLSTGRQVRILDDFSSGLASNLRDDPALEVVRGCVTDRNAIRNAVRGVDCIFHLAAVVGQIRVTDQPDWALEVAQTSVAHLNDLAPDIPTIFFSSSAVYGLTASGRCQESCIATEAAALAYDGGKQGYAYGKWQAEQMAARRRAQNWLTVRPFNLIGPGQIGTYGMVVPRFVSAALSRKPYIIHGSGKQSRSFCDVRAFVEHLLALHAAWIGGRTRHHIYNLGNAREVSIECLADTIDAVLGLKNDRMHVPFAEVYPGKRDVIRRQPDLARIHQLLGDLCWPALEHSVSDVARWLGPINSSQSISYPY